MQGLNLKETPLHIIASNKHISRETLIITPTIFFTGNILKNVDWEFYPVQHSNTSSG